MDHSESLPKWLLRTILPPQILTEKRILLCIVNMLKKNLRLSVMHLYFFFNFIFILKLHLHSRIIYNLVTRESKLGNTFYLNSCLFIPNRLFSFFFSNHVQDHIHTEISWFQVLRGNLIFFFFFLNHRDWKQ